MKGIPSLASVFLVLLLPWLACGPSPKQQGEPCTVNEDCQTGLKCLGEQCGDGKERSPCGRAVDCIKGLQCVNATCQRTESLSEAIGESTTEPVTEPNQDAGEPQRQDSQTEPPQETVRDDSEPPIERLPEARPQTPCRSQADCPNQMMCRINADRLTASCGPIPQACKKDADCRQSPGMFCRLLTLPSGTASATLCAYPFVTDNPLKKAGELCKQDTDCQSGICLDKGQCGAFCESDADCPQQFYCGTYTFFERGDFGGCYPKCSNDSDCPSAYTCNNKSQCTPKNPGQVGSACRSTTDCNGGLCLNNWNHGYCLTPCTPTGATCSLTQPCPAAHDCVINPDNEQQKICVPTCNNPGTTCALFGSKQGFCLRSCNQDSECREDYYCGAINEQNAKACLPRGNNKLGERCERGEQCHSGICRLFPTGRYCTQSCKGTGCPTGYGCSTVGTETVCEKVCIKNSDCPTGYQCIAQQCVVPPGTSSRKTGEACTNDSQCVGGTCFNNNGLFPKGYCTRSCAGPNASCPTGSACINYGGNIGQICTKTCQTDNSCARSDYFCFPIRLSNAQGQSVPCSNAQDCSSSTLSPICKADLSGRFCSIGVCLGRGTRQAGETCTNAFQCQSGFCYLKPAPLSQSCASSADCAGLAPICDTQAKQCVGCLANSDCPGGLSCINTQCSDGGYCASPCDSSNPCSQDTTCHPITNKGSTKIGDYCVPNCRSDLQCLSSFACKSSTSNQNVCVLP